MAYAPLEPTQVDVYAPKRTVTPGCRNTTGASIASSMLRPAFPVYEAASSATKHKQSEQTKQPPALSGRWLSLSALLATNLGAMRRLIVVILAFLTLAVPGPAAAGTLGPVLQQTQDVEQPAVVIEEQEEAPKEIAWTFRFLVPTLWLLTALLVVGTLVAYKRRLKKRFRVTG